MRTLVIVGSVTRPIPYFAAASGAGIVVLALDTATGAVERLWEQGGIDNPTYLAFDDRSSTVYAVSEVFGWNEGLVSAYRLDRRTGRLSYLNKQATLGSLPAQVEVDSGRRLLLVTNYGHEVRDETPGQAMAVFRLGNDGRLLPAHSAVRHTGRGFDPDRQLVPHPHCARCHPTLDLAFVADLGLDRVFGHVLDAEGVASGSASVECALDPGDGPRHFVFSDGGRRLHVLNELSSSLTSFEATRDDGLGWKRTGKISTLPPGAAEANLAADLQCSRDGRFLLVTNRGHDSIVTISPVSGRNLTVVGWTPTLGRTPRSLAVTADERFIVVANQDEDELKVFRRNVSTGVPTELAQTLKLGSPTYVQALVGS